MKILINCIICNKVHDIDMSKKVYNIGFIDLCCPNCKGLYDPVKRLNGELYIKV